MRRANAAIVLRDGPDNHQRSPVAALRGLMHRIYPYFSHVVNKIDHLLDDRLKVDKTSIRKTSGLSKERYEDDR
jgi:hypothetical protein